jgi:hypothetical protein
MKLTPDDFPIVMERDLREIWVAHRDVDVRRLILEVHRAREVHRLSHDDALQAHYAIWDKNQGNLEAAIKKLLERYKVESHRLGSVGGIPVQLKIVR